MTSPDHDSPQALAAAYALGALSPDEALKFEAFLATSAEARREVAEYREVAALLALDAPDATPGAALRARVMARTGGAQSWPLAESTGAPRPIRSKRPFALVGAIAASLAAAAILGGALFTVRNQVRMLERELARRDVRLAETERQLGDREATLNAILEPGVRLFQLTASGDPDPGIQLFWNQRRNQAIVHGFRLKPVPEGRAYQLWFIQDGKPVPSVTFKPEPDGHAKVEGVQVPTDGALSAAAVTVEPEAGSAQPTSPIILVGVLQKS
jgi:anti-sigma-K factor RskA